MKTSELEKRTQEKYGISDETMEAMKKFFLKTSVPRLIEKKRREKKDAS